jgi:FdhD protein
VLAALSAPTSLAVRVATECGQTLLGFARGDAFSIYTHGRRITHVNLR